VTVVTPVGTVAWAGGANCYYWVDPDGATAGVLFTQLVPFADPGVIGLFADSSRQPAAEEAAVRVA
jgi:hypothetical protein